MKLQTLLKVKKKKKIATHQPSTVNTEGGFEVCCFMKIVLETFAHGVAVGPNEIRFHLGFADHPISVTTGTCTM